MTQTQLLLRQSFRGQKGLTLVEILISLTIGSSILVVLAAAFFALLWLPGNASDTITSAQDQEQVGFWITHDGNRAEIFYPLTTPQYGRFEWSDRTGTSVVTYKVTYYYDSGLLMREEKQNDVVQSTLAIVRHIAAYSDITFTWSQSTYSLTVAVTVTVDEEGTRGASTFSNTITVFLRPRTESSVSAPGITPVPTPPPGSVNYYVASGPTLITGTYVSGNTASLHDTDSNFYVADAVAIGGTRWVTWWVDSEIITSPDPIGSIEIRFTGKSSRQNTVVSLYVVDPVTGNFDTIAASGFTYTTADTVTTHIFSLDAAVVTYLNTLPSPTIKLKQESGVNSIFTLSTDQIFYIVSP